MKTCSRGMSLLELMMALTVLGITLAIGIPAFRTFTVESRITAATNDVVTALNLARSEALRRAGVAVACASSNQSTCSGANDWTVGWIVFSDANANGTVDADELLQVWPAVNGGLTLTGDQNRVAYNSIGMSTSAVTVGVAGQGCSVQRKVNVTVSLSGSIRSNRTVCGS